MSEPGFRRALAALATLAGVTLAACGVPGGSVIAFFALAYAASVGLRPARSHTPSIVLAVVAAGALLDAALLTAAVRPELFPSLGPQDGVALRMLRLARVAAVTIPLLSFLHFELVGGCDRPPRAARIGEIAFTFGAAGLPIALTLAATVSPVVRHVLFIPADAAIVGVACSFLIARREGRRLEALGLVLIAASMVIGLGMGGYAFGGPLHEPAFLGGYRETARVLLRSSHAGAIVLGLLAITLSRLRRPVSIRTERSAGDDVLIAKLNLASIERSFVPEKDIDWTKGTTDEELERLYSEWSLLEGTGFDRRFDAQARVTYVKYQQMNLMLFTALLERHGVANLIRVHDLDPSPALGEYIGHFVKEEIYHYTMFTRAMRAIAETMPSEPPLPSRALDIAFRVLFRGLGVIPFERTRTLLTFTLFRFAERVTLFAHQTASRTIPRTDSLIPQVWRFHAIDEARHVAFDSLVIDRTRPSLPLARLLTVMMAFVSVGVSLLLNANEIWIARRLGAPIRFWHLPGLMRRTKAPFKRRVFRLIRDELFGRESEATTALAEV